MRDGWLFLSSVQGANTVCLMVHVFYSSSYSQWRRPEFLTIGHVTRDVQPDGSFSLGGTVAFAAVTASRLGLRAAIVTCADGQFLAQLPAHLPGIGLTVHPSPATTTFANQYYDGFRI